MKVRGHLQMYHAYIHESHPPSDSAPEEVNVRKKRLQNQSQLFCFQPAPQESEPGWEMLESGEGAVSDASSLNFYFDLVQRDGNIS